MYLEESPSGNVHGMPLRILAGDGPDELVNINDFTPKVKPENIVLIGMRDLDEGERKYIKDKLKLLLWRISTGSEYKR